MASIPWKRAQSLSLKRTSTTSGPLYCGYLEAGTLKLQARYMTDPANSVWLDKLYMNNVQCVEVEFDGHWEPSGTNSYELITDQYPYLFWVDQDGLLWCQLYNDETTKVQLSSSVSKVSAIRGWKNLDGEIVDQGLVAFYVKTDGTLWYRSYIMQDESTTLWETEIQITDISGIIIDIEPFRTNDYRIGLLYKVGKKLGLWFSKRSWSGTAITADYTVNGIHKTDQYVIDVSFSI